jgi:hypothetical protein
MTVPDPVPNKCFHFSDNFFSFTARGDFIETVQDNNGLISLQIGLDHFVQRVRGYWWKLTYSVNKQQYIDLCYLNIVRT